MGVARQSSPSPELKTFSARLKKAIAFKKQSREVIAKEAGYTLADFERLLKGMREPGFKKLILLANSLGCSVDYLLGLTPEAKQASIVINADTEALRAESIKSDKVKQFLALVPELLEVDIELLAYIAGFLIERKEKGLKKLIETVAAAPKKRGRKAGSTAKPAKEVAPKPKGNADFEDEEDFDPEDEDFEDEDDFDDDIFDDEDDFDDEPDDFDDEYDDEDEDEDEDDPDDDCDDDDFED
jgi:transcriptional regulator with XRE-family HTH domain